mmetsp:Transcript_90339/g.264307  ORF Transcript_90339/g.264307 Transcript_90339/m.264307 type:complete len:628 (+) Transcript_90339:235-2118(+)
MAPDRPLHLLCTRRALPRLTGHSLLVPLDVRPRLRVSLRCQDGAAHGAHVGSVEVGTPEEPVVQQVGRTMRYEGVALHLAEADAAAPLPALHRLVGDPVVRPPRAGLRLVHDQVPQALVVDDPDEDLRLELSAMYARVHALSSKLLEAVLLQDAAEVVRHGQASNNSPSIGTGLAVITLQEGVCFIVGFRVVVSSSVASEGCGVGPHQPVAGGRLASNALDEHADGHPRREAVRVEEDVRRDAALCEGHVLCWPQEAHHTFLTVARRELVAHHWVACVPELEHQPLARIRRIQRLTIDQGHLLHISWLLIMVSLNLWLASVVDNAVHGVAFLQVRPDGREAVVVQGLRLLLQRLALACEVAEAAPLHLIVAHSVAGSVDDLRLVHLAVGKSTVVGGLVDEHCVFHVVACVGDHRDDGVGARGVQVAVRLVVHLRARHRLLGVHDAEDLVVCSVHVVVVRSAHRLLKHLALVHVARTLVVVGEGRERGQEGQHPRGLQLLVRELQRQLLRKLVVLLRRLAAGRLARVLQQGVRPLPLLRQHRDVQEELLQWPDQFHLPGAQAGHRPHQAARPQEEEEPREDAAGALRDADDLQLRRHAQRAQDLALAQRGLDVAQPRVLHEAQNSAVE